MCLDCLLLCAFAALCCVPLLPFAMCLCCPLLCAFAALCYVPLLPLLCAFAALCCVPLLPFAIFPPLSYDSCEPRHLSQRMKTHVNTPPGFPEFVVALSNGCFNVFTSSRAGGLCSRLCSCQMYHVGQVTLSCALLTQV